MQNELEFATDPTASCLPITAICIVADKNKAPKGFVPVVKCQDDQSEADLWRDGIFTFKPAVRYICASREVPSTAFKGSVSVITNMTVVRENDPIPHGFVALDYTADSKEKSLRKKFLCVRTEPRDRVVDAIGEIVILAKTKKIPKNFTLAGEVDTLLICFKVVSIPPTFGIQMSSSTSALEESSGGLYPGLGVNSSASSISVPANIGRHDAFTMKNVGQQRVKGVDGVPFKLNPKFVKDPSKNDDIIPELPDIEAILSDPQYEYNFALENAVLKSS